MNQYELTPLPPEEHRRMRRYITLGFLAIVIFVIMLIFHGCSEQNDQQPRISGAWNSITYPANYYLFHSDGILEIHSLAAGQIVWEKWFTYEHNRETGALEIRDRNGLYFQGSVSFNQNADTACLERPDGLMITLSKW